MVPVGGPCSIGGVLGRAVLDGIATLSGRRCGDLGSATTTTQALLDASEKMPISENSVAEKTIFDALSESTISAVTAISTISAVSTIRAPLGDIFFSSNTDTSPASVT